MLVHPKIDELDAAADNRLLGKQGKAAMLEEGPRGDARLREQTADPAQSRLRLQGRQEQAPGSAPLVIRVDEEMIEMPVVLNVAEAEDDAVGLDDDAISLREPGPTLPCPIVPRARTCRLSNPCD